MTKVTDQERLDFLRRQGWRDDMNPEDKKQIEDCWTEADIEMAVTLNIA